MDELKKFDAFYKHEQMEYVFAYYNFADPYSAKILYGNPELTIEEHKGPHSLKIHSVFDTFADSQNEIHNGIRYETYLTGTKVIHRGIDGSQPYFRKYVYFPIGKEEDLEELPQPDVENLEAIKNIPKEVKIAKEKGLSTSIRILGPFNAPYYYLRKFDEYLMDLARRPKFAEKMIKFCMKFQLNKLDIALSYGVDEVRIAEDIGTGNGPLISPDAYRRFFKDWQKEIIDRAHKKGAYVHMHSDGNIMMLLDDIIATGIDALNPLCPLDMDLKLIKQKYGDKISLQGGISRLLSKMTPSEVLEHWRNRIEIAAPGGGYYIGPAGGISYDTPKKIADLVVSLATTKEHLRVPKRQGKSLNQGQ